MIVYRIDDLYDQEFVVFSEFSDLMEAIREEICCNDMLPGDMTLRIHFIEMTQEEYDALSSADI